MSLLDLFCAVDDFCQMESAMERLKQIGDGKRQRQRKGELHLSEIMTLVIHFHQYQSSYRTFKAYYTEHVEVNLGREFPNLVSYGRFVELMPRVLVPLSLYMQKVSGQCSDLFGINLT
jgi:hypothetical protein